MTLAVGRHPAVLPGQRHGAGDALDRKDAVEVDGAVGRYDPGALERDPREAVHREEPAGAEIGVPVGVARAEAGGLGRNLHGPLRQIGIGAEEHGVPAGECAAHPAEQVADPEIHLGMHQVHDPLACRLGSGSGRASDGLGRGGGGRPGQHRREYGNRRQRCGNVPKEVGHIDLAARGGRETGELLLAR